MFAQAHSPGTLLPQELDTYLEQGWFRMGQTIFTTNFLNFKNQFYSALWLRIVLQSFHSDQKQKKIFRINSGFRSEIKKATINPEKEALFSKYKEGISFDASASLHHLLFGTASHTIYNTFEVNIYDSDKLIATGFFDLGDTSAAGISSFYDPAYKKYSLGKFLIYLKIEHCKNQGLKYFYPGYFVPGYPLFDYKLEIGRSALQYLQFSSYRWLPMESFSRELTPLQIMHEKLSSLQHALLQSSIESLVLKYEFFDANLIPELKGADLFDFPLFLSFTKSMEEDVNQLIVYDLRGECYRLIRCFGVLKTNVTNKSVDIYSSFALKIEQDLFSTSKLEELVNIILIEAKHQESSLI
jgi:leucyl-tRNA---protein transferase